MMRFIIFCLQSLLVLWFFSAIEGKHVAKDVGGEADTFIAAVYEHLPFLAVPVCYEKGKRYNNVIDIMNGDLIFLEPKIRYISIFLFCSMQ